MKERLFGLTGNEGNHGEDVKEYYFYLDSTPTHSYMKYLYKYPQAEFPYGQLVEENRRRGKLAPEFELVGIDFGGNLEHCRAEYPQHRWLEWELEGQPLPQLPESVVADCPKRK